MEAQGMSSQGKDSLAGDTMESLGVHHDEMSDANQHESEGTSNEGNIDHAKALSSAKKRMKAMGMNHEREIRDLHARMADLQTKLAPQPSYGGQEAGHYNMQPQAGGVDEQIHKAVSFALNHRDMEERKAKEAQNQAHVQKKYKELYNHLDNMGDKYDDFHDTVFGDESHFTPSMRDYAVTLPKSGRGSAGEVLYNLGKNPEELKRISKLPSVDQAEEMSRLSHALVAGGDQKANTQSRPLGQVKSNPVNASNASVTEKTPIGSIRSRMKAGTFK